MRASKYEFTYHKKKVNEKITRVEKINNSNLY
jgi:hypothetical protein